MIAEIMRSGKIIPLLEIAHRLIVRYRVGLVGATVHAGDIVKKLARSHKIVRMIIFERFTVFQLIIGALAQFFILTARRKADGYDEKTKKGLLH
jgi:hypothetical protein